MAMVKRGKLIVIDGIDGSGKATQAALLAKHLKRIGVPVRSIDFPRYEDNFFGTLIAECLRGEHGDFISLPPKIASVLYAADRFESRGQITDWLSKGYVVVSDRYTTSSQIHQVAKVRDRKEAKQLLAWLEEMEYGIFKLPRPDAVVYLDVPADVSWKLLQEVMQKKKYLKGKGDQAELNRVHQEHARKNALSIIRTNDTWVTVNCIKMNAMRSIEEIHQEIIERVTKRFRFRRA